MSKTFSVLVHESQYPAAVREEFVRSLRERAVNHKFHYESYKQTAKWLELHERYSPARTDLDCVTIYDRAFAAAAELAGPDVTLVGLGAGGGQKDASFLEILKAGGKRTGYVPLDVSTPMVLTAALTAKAESPVRSAPIVVDLGVAEYLSAIIDPVATGREQIFTFFGMIPNFHPELILPRLRHLIRSGAILLLSANLSPGTDYARGVSAIVPQYDNQLTREWLMMFLLDLGVDYGDGELRWTIEGDRFLRITASFHFSRERRIRAEGESFEFHAGDRVQLFFSYRYRTELLKKLLIEYGFEVENHWITQSGEEGVFLCH